MSQDCFFNCKDEKNFGSSRGLSGLVRLSECNDEVKHHLISCHLSKEVLSENELILARTGLFHLTQEDREKCGFAIGIATLWESFREVQRQHVSILTMMVSGSVSARESCNYLAYV